MPLSEHEQRLLDQIERQLYADDPKFASTVRASDLKTHLLRRIKRSAAMFVLGVILLVTGAATKQWPIGVAGFAVMLGAGLLIARSAQQLGGQERSRRPARRAGPRGSLMSRVEERWRRRWDERGNR